jgi:peptidoglycan-N-acetylglucosamine deacetylase
MCSAALLAGLLLAAPAAAAGAPGLRAAGRRGPRHATAPPALAPGGAGPGLARAALAQRGRELVLSLWTRSPAALAQLEPQPSSAPSRYLCVELARAGGEGERRLCLGGPQARRRLGLERVDGSGAIVGSESVAATVKRPRPEKLVAAFVPGDAGLAPHRYRWRVVASGGCDPGRRCAESLPEKGDFAFRLRPVRAVGCTTGAGLVTHGPADRKVVALTFDDGPSEYTPGFLRVLREKGVDGTFFEIGQEMPGREATMRRILAEGSEIGDHTMNHVEYPGYAQIAGAAARIQAYTHFKPCLFRPPGGGVNSSVIATAAGLGLFTVNWNVDPRDWSTPGTAAIYSTIVDTTRPGSIILMHDGGGNRSETLAALPHVIDTLRARGYRFTTVSQLLGGRIFYAPYG